MTDAPTTQTDAAFWAAMGAEWHRAPDPGLDFFGTRAGEQAGHDAASHTADAAGSPAAPGESASREAADPFDVPVIPPWDETGLW